MTQVVIGRITRPQGIRGEVRVYPLTDFPERFEDGNKVYLRGQSAGEWRRIRKHRRQGNLLIVKFEGIDDRNAAETLRNVQIEIAHSKPARLPENSHYVNDLIGLSVKTEAGEIIGTLDDVRQDTSQDLYVVRNGEKEILIPGVEAFIKNIDIEAGEIIITPIEGLLE